MKKIKDKEDRIVFLLNRLRTANKFYTMENTTEPDRGRILEAVEPIIVELNDLGIRRDFSTLYILYGNEFLQAEYEVKTLDVFISDYIRQPNVL